MIAQDIINDLLIEQNLDLQSAIYALEDGEYLSQQGWEQEEVEVAHAELISRQ